MRRAEREWRKNDSRSEVDHQAYLAQRQVDLAVATGQRRETERSIEQASRERDAIQIEQSRRQADSAQAQATTAQMQADQERQRADQLASRLRELQAKETERGLVVTFSDVLFDVGRAELRPGALARVDQLASVMREYPERNVLIEGFTDSTGSQATNQELSERRAMSVRQALVARGIDGGASSRAAMPTAIRWPTTRRRRGGSRIAASKPCSWTRRLSCRCATDRF